MTIKTLNIFCTFTVNSAISSVLPQIKDGTIINIVALWKRRAVGCGGGGRRGRSISPA